MGPSDLPWWGWLLCAAVAGIIAKVGMVVANDARLDKKKWAQEVVAAICGFVGFWVAVSTGAIGIASLSHFWQVGVLAGLLLIILAGMITIRGQLTRLEERVDELSDLTHTNMREQADVSRRASTQNSEVHRHGVVP
jgi:cytochrome c biogenesis protein CcdA